MPCSASAAASAASGRLCCSSGAQASSTGRPLRGSGAVPTARSALPAVSASRCSTSTPSPVAAHRSPTATSTGQSSSVQVGITPWLGHRPLDRDPDRGGVQRHRGPGQPAGLGGAAGQRQHPAAGAAGPDAVERAEPAGRTRRRAVPVAGRETCSTASLAASAGDTPSSTSRRMASSRAMSERE